jgi:Putative zinc-finger
METSHLSKEVLDRFARGDLGDEDLSAVLAHLATCPSCAQAGREHARRDIAALQAELTAKPVEGSRRSAAQRSMAWSLAAAAAIALAILAALLLPRERKPSPSADPPVVRDETPPRQTPPPPQTTTQIAASYASPQWQKLVSQAQETGRLPFPSDLAELQRPEDVVRGPTNAAERVSPSAIVIDEVRPAFTWPSRSVGTYVVSVFDEDQREVVRSPALKAPRWTPFRDLPRGRTLTWQVEVTRGDALETIPRPPAPPATFRIVSERHHEDLARAKALHPGDPLLHSLLYAHSGMRSEALASLRLAARGNAAAKRILDHENARPH